MKKLKLELDELRVESFGAEMEDEEEGTVQGHDFLRTRSPTCARTGCCEPTWDTCDATCGSTCLC